MHDSLQQRTHWDPYLIDWWGSSYTRRLICLDGKVWFVKSAPQSANAAGRELLAYLLGKDWLNIAEVRRLQPGHLNAIKKWGADLPSGASPDNTYLVRLGFDYSWFSLPIKSPDSASAAEIVFSLWIRRRDAHSYNRVYVGGTPVFFDHLSSLLAEPGLVNLDTFFACGPDAGYAGWWHFEEVRGRGHFDLLRIREEEKRRFRDATAQPRTVLPVHDWPRARRMMFKVGERIQGIAASDIFEKALQAGFAAREATAITEFLNTSKTELTAGIQRIIENTEKGQLHTIPRETRRWMHLFVNGWFNPLPAGRRLW